jgi:hypothetical protein
MRVFSFIGGALLSALSFSPVAHAATVGAVEGEVLVNSGSGFKPITGALARLPGAARAPDQSLCDAFDHRDLGIGCLLLRLAGLLAFAADLISCRVCARCPAKQTSGL